MKINNVLASVAVRDLRTARAWYERVLGRPADSQPMEEVSEWQFEGGGWLQVYQLAERAGAGSFTLAVANVAEASKHLDSIGIDTSNQTSSDLVKTVMITDPDGNHIAFAEAISPTLAQ